MKALIDTNVLLDVLLPREPWAAESKAVWDAADAGTFEAYISGVSFPNVFYIPRKIIGIEKAHEAVRLLFDAFEVAPIDASTVEAALVLKGSDFEDNLQIASALASRSDAIVTRDPKGLANTRCQVLSPAEFLSRLASAQGSNP